MRKRRLLYNTISSVVFQMTAIICGFILPRLILIYYGSEVNGLVNSITQFIKFISFLELGVGAVVQSALYKPLADKDNNAISGVVVSAQRFFSMLAKIMLGYVIVLIAIYPFIANQDFGWIYTSTLIIAISISSFAQYYFGIVNLLLLTADQKGYIQYLIHTGTLILNTVACVILMRMGQGIHVVKLTTSLIFLLRPFLMKLYVDRHYNINRHITYTEEPIKQKWNGVAQHVSAIVLDNTDTVVLTLFSTLTNVSIYSVYHLIVYGVKNIFSIITNGVQSLLGELWAKQELVELKSFLGWTEWTIHTGVTYAFGCTLVLICPFVSVYTKGIDDANYIVPLFAGVITIANAVHGLRMPYISMIFAGDKYKETQNNFIISAAINLVVSIVTVTMWGLVGVAIGTLVAMAYQTVWMAWYVSRNLVKWPFKNFIKQLCVDIFTWILGYFASCWIVLEDTTYSSWIIMAIKVAAIWLAIIIVINIVFYPVYMKRLIKKVNHKSGI